MAEKKDRVPAVTLFFTVLLFGMVSLTLYHNTRAHDFAGRPRTREAFEYRTVSPPDAGFDEAMSALGAEGWEAVHARRASDGDRESPTMSYEVILRRKRLVPIR